jgi:hypothetical protein
MSRDTIETLICLVIRVARPDLTPEQRHNLGGQLAYRVDSYRRKT